MKNTTEITLDCGMKAVSWTYRGSHLLEVSLINLYDGHGPENDPALLSKLFDELARKGYTLNGLSRVTGLYDSTNDLMLTAIKRLS